MVPNQQENFRQASTSAGADDSAASFVTTFSAHHKRCVALAKRFVEGNPDLKGSAAISQLCRASQEMLEQAKEARALTEIYLALDENHRDAVRSIITERFKDIAKLARASWLRFCDSVKLVQVDNPEIAVAQGDFEPHAEAFEQTLRAFITMIAKAG